MHQMLPLTRESGRVDKRVWRACAGSSVQIPCVGARVFYFPEGHIEQSFLPGLPSPPLGDGSPLPPMLLCQISDVNLLADPITDEVYAKLLLCAVPCTDDVGNYTFGKDNGVCAMNARSSVEFEDRSGEIISFAKILTPSDANNGGGFSVPRFCADSIFPPLDYQADPPVQKLTVTDVHGVVWEFRHIYRGTPRRHLLTTGWSKFVNHKKLVAGDSVVFMRSLRGELFIGVRRAVRFYSRGRSGSDYSKWRDQIGGMPGDKVVSPGDMFRRSGRDWLSPDVVAQAVERAKQGLPFEAVYYPKVGWYSDFVVRADVVMAALNVLWRSGMRVKMAMETEDSSRMTWFQGTIVAAAIPNDGPWRSSPWRMLHIRWDEPEVLQNYKRVSPWQVEIVAPTPSLDAVLPQSKRYKFLEHSGLLTDGNTGSFFPLSGPSDSTVSSSLLSYNTFPASIQGTRHDVAPTFGAPSFTGATHQLNLYGPFAESSQFKVGATVTTDLNIGNSVLSNLSPDSQSTGHYFGAELPDTQERISGTDAVSSIQLFGKVIHLNDPANFREVAADKGDVNDPEELPSSSLTDLHSKICIEAAAET